MGTRTTSDNASWKLQRATVHRSPARRPRSNRYSKSDTSRRPAAGTRTKVWVGGYTRSDGTRVVGHYRVATGR